MLQQSSLLHFCFFGLHSKLKDFFFHLVVFAPQNCFYKEHEFVSRASKHASSTRWQTGVFWELTFSILYPKLEELLHGILTFIYPGAIWKSQRKVSIQQVLRLKDSDHSFTIASLTLFYCFFCCLYLFLRKHASHLVLLVFLERQTRY